MKVVTEYMPVTNFTADVIQPSQFPIYARRGLTVFLAIGLHDINTFVVINSINCYIRNNHSRTVVSRMIQHGAYYFEKSDKNKPVSRLTAFF